MKKAVFLTSASFLLAATMAFAQDQSPSSGTTSTQDPNATQTQQQQSTSPSTTTPSAQTPSTDTTQSSSATSTTSGSQTIQGCLSQSGDQYTIAANGKTYNITGDTSQLKDHVNQTVAITGTVTPAASSSSSSTGAEANATTGNSSSMNNDSIAMQSVQSVS